MIYDIYGNQRVARALNGSEKDVAYDLYGNEKSLNLLLDENFNSFNTSVWSCRSGNYRDWIWLPEDYTNNAFIQNGNLVVRNLKDYPHEGFDWSGAFVHSQGKFQFQYGTVISRLKLPADANKYHATLWMLGNNPGEIDIAESDSGSVWAALHWYDRSGNLHSKNIGFYGVVTSEWHTYQMDWSADKITFRCDGDLLGSFDVDDATIDGYNSFRQPFYLIFNTNPYSTSQDVYATSESVTNYVDYIHVYGSQNNNV